MRIVALDDGRAARDQALEDLGLGVGNLLDVSEVLEVHASTVVTMAACGRTMPFSGAISPAWFMPISKTPKSVSRGMLASVSGTPQ